MKDDALVQKAIKDLESINELDIRYLLVNRDLSFIDVSTLEMIELKIKTIINNLKNEK